MDTILSLTFDWICTKVQWGATFVIMLVINTITGSEVPGLNLDYFYNNIFINGSLDKVIYGFKIAGLSLTIIIFFLNTYLVGIRDLLQSKDNMIDLVRRLFLSAMLVFFITSIFDLTLNYAQDLMNYAGQERVTESGYAYFGLGDSDIDSNMSIMGDISDTANADPIIQNDTGKQTWIAKHFGWLESLLERFYININPKYVVLMIVRIIFFCLIAYNFVKLCVEFLKRYTTMCVLYMMSPLFSAFFASGSTQLIFLSYFKMFVTTVLIMALTKIWIYLSAILMQNVISNFINMCIIIAFINFGVKLEMWTREIGMSTANLGGALLDNIVITAGIMGRAGKEAFSHVGNGLLNAGGLTGDAKLAAAGSTMTGKSLTPDNIFRTMNESTGGVIRQDKTKTAKFSNLTPTQMDLASKTMPTNGLFRNATLSNMYQSLNTAGKQELMQGLMKDTYAGFSKVLNDAGMKISDLTYDNKGINFTATGKNGIRRNCTIGEAPAKGIGVTSIGGFDANGKQIYLNMQSGWEDLKNAKGKTFTDSHIETVSKDKDGKETTSTFIPQLNGTSAIEMETGTNLSAFVQGNDTDASHYQAIVNDIGNLDIQYAADGKKFTDIGAVTDDGLNLFKGTCDYGDNIGNKAVLISDGGMRQETSDIPFEADFALQFAMKGQTISIDCSNGSGGYERQNYGAITTGALANMHRTNISHVQRMDDGSIRYKYNNTSDLSDNRQKYTGFIMDAYDHQGNVTANNICGDKKHGSKISK